MERDDLLLSEEELPTAMGLRPREVGEESQHHISEVRLATAAAAAKAAWACVDYVALHPYSSLGEELERLGIQRP